MFCYCVELRLVIIKLLVIFIKLFWGLYVFGVWYIKEFYVVL